jgi:hypothetical protein
MNVDAENSNLEGPLSIEVFIENGECRASSIVSSIPEAFAWLDIMPISRGPEERLLIRIEDERHDGCWIYVGAAGDASSAWICSRAAKRLRSAIERRRIVGDRNRRQDESVC